MASDLAFTRMRQRLLDLVEILTKGERLSEPGRLAAGGVRALSCVSSLGD